MLLVKTSVGPSNISGLGLFADQFIEKGTIIWQLSEPLDLVLAKELVQNLPLLAKQTFLKHGYFSKKLEKYILSFDNDRFTNHSEDPNVLEGEVMVGGETVTVAVKDILAGEEITCDYAEFDKSHYERIFSPESRVSAM